MMGVDSEGKRGGRASDPTVIRRRPAVRNRATEGTGDGGPADAEPSGERPQASTTNDDDTTGGTTSKTSTLDATVTVDPDIAIRAVLASEEATRAHGFAVATLLLAGIVAIALPFLGGDTVGAQICGASLALIIGVSVWVLDRTRDGGHYSGRVFRVQAWTLTTAILGVEYYLGFYSPVTVVLSLGIYYLGQAHDRTTAMVTSTWAMLGWAGGCVLIAADVIGDRGLFTATGLELGPRVFIIVAVVASLVMTLAMARLAHDSVRRAIKHSNDAVMTARKQAAQLAEAKNQLDRAMKLAIGKPGQHTGQLAGNCEMGVLIGLGAMGEVYEAIDHDTGQPVAVKLLHDATRQSAEVVQRFLREADISRQLDHPHLVDVRSAGTLDGGDPFLVMERLQGADLGALLRAERSLPLQRVRVLCEQVAAGIEHAHGCGVIHRDLKPHNLFRATDDNGGVCWKVLDFGISRMIDASGTLTQGGVVGTPAYMSPEQARGKRLDGRSDVFALAAVVYRALTGRPAFPGEDTPRIMFDVAYRQPDKPSLQTEGIPGDVDLVLALGLAKDPDDRFESVTAFAQALAAASKRKLPDATRLRAVALLQKHPWGFSPDYAQSSS